MKYLGADRPRQSRFTRTPPIRNHPSPFRNSYENRTLELQSVNRSERRTGDIRDYQDGLSSLRMESHSRMSDSVPTTCTSFLYLEDLRRPPEMPSADRTESPSTSRLVFERTRENHLLPNTSGWLPMGSSTPNSPVLSWREERATGR